MPETSYRAYRYRWVILGAYMLVMAAVQMLWLTFAPITSAAAHHYGVSDLTIGLLAMSFMIVYLFVGIPASWVIDTYGYRISVGAGALLIGVFGLLRGIFHANFTLVFLAQLGIAVGQPFITNAATKVSVRWFPLNERATATGLGTLGMYLGIVVGMLLSPFLFLRCGMGRMLLVEGGIALASTLVFILFARESPPSPPCAPRYDERALMFDGLKNLFRQKDFLLLMGVFFIGLGIFNGVSTWIENIVGPRGFSISQAGMLGGLMVMGGVLGAVILPILSDRFRRRKPFIVMAFVCAVPGLFGMGFATDYRLLLLSGFVFGFFLLGAGPIGFQYGAEITRPTPEGTSNGLLLLIGQIAGIIYIFAMDAGKTPQGSMAPGMAVSTILILLSSLLCLKLREPEPAHVREQLAEAAATKTTDAK